MRRIPLGIEIPELHAQFDSDSAPCLESVGSTIQEYRNMEWVDAIAQSDLPDGSREVVELGGHSILLIHEGDRIYAIASACPHMGAPLEKATINDGTIVCYRHHSAFDLETGDVQEWSPWPPVVGPVVLSRMSRKKVLPVYPTKIEDGRIWVGLDEST